MVRGSIDSYLLEDDVKLSLNKLANVMSGWKKKPFGVKESIWKEKDKQAVAEPCQAQAQLD